MSGSFDTTAPLSAPPTLGPLNMVWNFANSTGEPTPKYNPSISGSSSLADGRSISPANLAVRTESAFCPKIATKLVKNSLVVFSSYPFNCKILPHAKISQQQNCFLASACSSSCAPQQRSRTATIATFSSTNSSYSTPANRTTRVLPYSSHPGARRTKRGASAHLSQDWTRIDSW